MSDRITLQTFTDSTITPTEVDEKIEAAIANINTKKQDKLVSGTNIKTINGNSLLGSGDLVIEGGSGSSITYTDFVLSNLNADGTVSSDNQTVITNALSFVYDNASNIISVHCAATLSGSNILWDTTNVLIDAINKAFTSVAYMKEASAAQGNVYYFEASPSKIQMMRGDGVDVTPALVFEAKYLILRVIHIRSNL